MVHRKRIGKEPETSDRTKDPYGFARKEGDTSNRLNEWQVSHLAGAGLYLVLIYDHMRSRHTTTFKK